MGFARLMQDYGEMSRQRPDASVAVSGYAFGAILAYRWLVFQWEIREIHFFMKYRNTA